MAHERADSGAVGGGGDGAPIVVWLRRDVRLADNTALAEAGRRTRRIIPLWVVDPALLSVPGMGAARVSFLYASLRELAGALEALGSRLIVRRGDPRAIVPAVAREAGAAAVYWNDDYTPAAQARDAAVATALGADGVEARGFTDALLHDPAEPVTAAGTPYTVYSPYRRAWLALPKPAVVAGPGRLEAVAEHIGGAAVPTEGDLGWTAVATPPPGEAAARRLLTDFTAERIAGYAEGRDVPASPAVSLLSPHLRFGTVSPRQVYWAAREAGARLGHPADRGVATFIAELAWREFFYHVAYHAPRMLRSSYNPQYDSLAWDNDPQAFAAWREGRTGYPLVDAAMRQLNTTGWMHNRGRLVVGSFLTKDLLISWQWSERYFMERLADGDPIVNNGNWQWVAGTGCDAAPYFRIFNPTLQAQKFDPDGDYIRQFVPELAHVPQRYIHAPWAMPDEAQRASACRLGHDYPLPIVDHLAQRARTLAAYEAVRGGHASQSNT